MAGERRRVKKRIIIVQGDITESTAEAIVNAANNHLWMGSGVAGAIKGRGGQSIEDEAMAQGPILVGEAAVTKAGKLKCRYVIHAASMGQDLVTDEGKIRHATGNALQRAEELQIKSIDFPALGTGVGGFPLPEAAAAMIGEARQFLIVSKFVAVVRFVLFDRATFEAYRTELGTESFEI